MHTLTSPVPTKTKCQSQRQNLSSKRCTTKLPHHSAQKRGLHKTKTKLSQQTTNTTGFSSTTTQTPQSPSSNPSNTPLTPPPSMLTPNFFSLFRNVLGSASTLDSNSVITFRKSLDLILNTHPWITDKVLNNFPEILPWSTPAIPIYSKESRFTPQEQSEYVKAYKDIWLSEINHLYTQNLKKTTQNYSKILTPNEASTLSSSPHSPVTLNPINNSDFEPIMITCGPKHSGLSRQVFPEGSNIILFSHGGAYVMGHPKWSVYQMFLRNWAQLLNKDADEDKPESQFFIVSLNYHLAPDSSHPTALFDVMAGYEYVVKTYRPGKIFLAGDSAGGNLSLSVNLALQHLFNVFDQNETEKLAKKLIRSDPNPNPKNDPPNDPPDDPLNSTFNPHSINSFNFIPRKPDGVLGFSSILDGSPQSLSISLFGLVGNIDNILPATGFNTVIQAYMGLCKAKVDEFVDPSDRGFFGAIGAKVIDTTNEFIGPNKQNNVGNESTSQPSSRSGQNWFKKMVSKSPLRHLFNLKQITAATTQAVLSTKLKTSPRFHNSGKFMEYIENIPKNQDGTVYFVLKDVIKTMETYYKHLPTDDDFAQNSEPLLKAQETMLTKTYRPFGQYDTQLPIPSSITYDNDMNPRWYGQLLVKNDRFSIGAQFGGDGKIKNDGNDDGNDDGEQNKQSSPYSHSLQTLTLADTLLNHYSISPVRAFKFKKDREIWLGENNFVKKNDQNDQNDQNGKIQNWSPDITSLLASPSLDESPPTMIVAGGREMLYGDAISYFEALNTREENEQIEGGENRSMFEKNNIQNVENDISQTTPSKSPLQHIPFQKIHFPVFNLNESLTFIIPRHRPLRKPFNIESLQEKDEKNNDKKSIKNNNDDYFDLYQHKHRLTPFYLPKSIMNTISHRPRDEPQIYTHSNKKETKFDDQILINTDIFTIQWKAYCPFDPFQVPIHDNAPTFGLNDLKQNHVDDLHYNNNLHHPILSKAISLDDINFDNIAETYFSFLSQSIFTQNQHLQYYFETGKAQKRSWSSTHYAEYNTNWSHDYELLPYQLRAHYLEHNPPDSSDKTQQTIRFNPYLPQDQVQTLYKSTFNFIEEAFPTKTASQVIVRSPVRKMDHLKRQFYHQFFISPHMFHVFPLLPLLPQSEETMRLATDWVRGIGNGTGHKPQL